jgi:cysteine desulfurase
VSTHRRIYLDFNATAPVLPSVTAAMTAALTEVGNPSSIHAEGRAARDRIERARNRVAALLDRPREQVVFTSGGTEANLVGVRALAGGASSTVAWTTPIEHPSLRAALAGWDVRLFAVDAAGRVQLPAVAPAGLVAVGYVNHEIGTVQDLAAIAAWAREAGARLHVDAVQAAGKLPLGIGDAIAISAHKLGGPMGIGAVALAVEGGADGGHQERGRRPGTENVAGIVGFGVAAEVDPSTWAPVAALGDRLEAGLVALGARIHGGHRVGGTINAAWDGVRGESIVMALDLAGVAVSTGAACTSVSVQPSPVLLGLGLPADRAREAVRFSLGRSTTAGEIDHVLALLPAIVDRARRFG